MYVGPRTQEWHADNPLRKWRIPQSREAREIEEQIGVPRNRVQYWETGEASPNKAEMRKLMRLTGIANLQEEWAKWRERRPRPRLAHHPSQSAPVERRQAEPPAALARSLVPWSELGSRLDEEIQRCVELGLTFSLIEIQLNDFEADAWGERGDQDTAVQHLLGTLEQVLREPNELSHDGTGRFAALLMRTPKPQAVELVQKTLDAMGANSVSPLLLGVDRLSFSSAVLTYPEDGRTGAALLHRLSVLLTPERRV